MDIGIDIFGRAPQVTRPLSTRVHLAYFRVPRANGFAITLLNKSISLFQGTEGIRFYDKYVLKSSCQGLCVMGGYDNSNDDDNGIRSSKQPS